MPIMRGLNKATSWRVGLALLSLAVGLLACAPAPVASRSSAQPGGPAASSGPKTLRIASLREPVKGLAPPGGTQFGDQTSIAYIFHAGLTLYDSQGNLQAHVATKVPTLEDGDWAVFPDGRMEVTWRLRPDVRWHDGVALTADDFVFGVTLVQDTEVPLFRGQANSALSDAIALDPLTLVVRWNHPDFLANASGPMDIPAVPARLVREAYDQRDMQAFINNPYWTTSFIGIGAFKLTGWELGSHTTAEAFDSFFLGRPKIDRVVIRYFTDLNAMVANLLAGEIDVIPAGTIKIEEVLQIRSAWDPVGAGTVLQSRAEIETIRVQFRNPEAPWAADVRVRRAMAHMTDRQALVDALLYGTTTVADVVVAPDDPVYQLVARRGYQKYGFDVATGDRLMAEAGWAKSGDGFVNATGERFGLEFRAVANSEYNTRQALAMTDQWRSAGLNPNLVIIPPAASNREELKATPNGVYWIPNQLTPRALEIFASDNSSNEASRWRGTNYGSYSNPTYDQLYHRFNNTLEVQPRRDIQVELLQLAAEDLPAIPTLYAVNYATAFRSYVHGPGPIPPSQLVSTWNIYSWDMS
jgi:peptide/nickel transport system substrate-binding protein